MTRATSALLIILASLALPASANTFLLTGQLDDGAAAADGLFTFGFELLEGTTVVWSETQDNVVVVDGVFAVDVGAATPLPAGASGAARLRITVEGDVLPLLPLARLGRVDVAGVVLDATRSVTAAQLAGVRAADAARRSLLAVEGGTPVHFGNLSGVPADIADGDQGVDVTAGANGLTFQSGLLAMGNEANGDRFASGAISGAEFPNASITSANVVDGAVTQVKVGNDLTRADLAANPIETKVAGIDVFLVTAANCKQPVNTLMTTGTCDATVCSLGGVLQGRLPCNGSGACAGLNPSTCPNSRAGTLVAQ